MQNQPEGITGVGQVSLLIRDTDRATDFFMQTLGLERLYSFGDLAFFDCGGTRLYSQRVSDEQWRPGSIVYFCVADIETRYRQLVDRGVVFDGGSAPDSPPRLRPRGVDGLLHRQRVQHPGAHGPSAVLIPFGNVLVADRQAGRRR